MPRPPKPTKAELRLKRENDELLMRIIRLRYEVENKQGAVGRLEILMRERMDRIDDLNAKLEQSRQQIKRLDDENERLVEMVRLPLGNPL